MTLLHVSVSRSKAYVASDTIACALGRPIYRPDGRPLEVEKVFALPHIGALLVSGGRDLIGSSAFLCVRDAADFDAAVTCLKRAIPEILTDADTARANKIEPGIDVVCVVGWNPKIKSMQLASFMYDSRVSAASMVVDLHTPGQAGDSWATLMTPPLRPPEKGNPDAMARHARLTPRSVESAAACARAAIAQARAKDAHAPYGGALVVWELTQKGHRAVVAGSIDMPPRVADGGDVVSGSTWLNGTKGVAVGESRPFKVASFDLEAARPQYIEATTS